MNTMGSRSATELLQLRAKLRGIILGRPVDLLLDATAWRVLGFIVLRDLRMTSAGPVDALLVEQQGEIREIEPAVARIGYVRAA
jgi:hypothetical protein